MSIGSLPATCARRYPHKPAVKFRDRTITFAEFNDRVERLTVALRHQGLTKGDKVAILSRNCPEMLEVMFATARAGMVYVPLNFRLAPPELKYVLNDADVQMLLVGDDFQPEVAQIRNQINCPTVLGLDEEYDALLVQGIAGGQPEEVSGDDLFAIFYTSGTTGGPKGVMLTNDNFFSAALNHIIAYQFSPADVCYHSQPFYHTMQASLAICCFYVGCTSYVVENFDPHQFWQAVRDDGVTMITLVYTMLLAALDAYEDGGYDKGAFHSFTVGGQSVPVDIIRRTHQLLGPGMLFQVYGLTEASPLLTYLPREEMHFEGPESKRLASIGKELFSCHVRVVDEQDRDVQPGEFGEIIARGPNVMKGYWGRPQETADSLRGGWLRTGDVATVDEEGYLYIVDRKKDIIISGGENISSREVEEAVYLHPKVQECAVIGLQDPKWGEQVRACVVLKDGSQLAETELIEFCRQHLAKYKCPRSVVYVDALPKDPLGKIQKRILRESWGAE
jgi:long-chain acyl-CoA synthetase